MSDVKATLRQTAFAARKRAFDARHDSGAVAAATAHLLALIGPASGHVIAGYMPIRTELDVRPAMVALHEQGARLCVPVIEGKGLPLVFRQWWPDAPMVAGPFGAMIPDGGDWLVPDTLIVPLVAFDPQANRLGYGGGFYDRTLAGLAARPDAARPLRAYGFAFAAQSLPSVAPEPTDVALDAIVTEHGVLHP